MTPGRLAAWPAWARFLSAAVAGAAAVPGFAPLGLFPLPVLALAWLLLLVQTSVTRRAAAVCGFAFGLALFTAGTGWVYVALHRYGGMPFFLAAPATLLFAAFLALYPAAVAGLARWVAPPLRWSAFAGAWVVAEWLRGWIFTGFPWLAFGYSQVPHSPLAGYAPLGGVFGVSLAVAACAAGLSYAVSQPARRRAALVWVGVIVGAGWVAGALPWTQPAGSPVGVTLVQGNVAQELKFREDRLLETLLAYAEAAAGATTPLTILPETALPILRHDLPPDYVERLREGAAARGGDLIVGAFENDPPGSSNYYNAVFSLGTSPSQSYRKQHLVPFGEFIPLEPVLGPVIREWLHIPLSSQARGPRIQSPLSVAGQRVAMTICYEDVFGEELIQQLPQATLIANVTNDAWYGESWASRQHMQISQMRALEAGRWMLRATNTGVTAAIDDRGHVVARLPEFRRDVLVTEAQGRTGATPYVRFGNAAALAVALLAVAAGVLGPHVASRRALGV